MKPEWFAGRLRELREGKSWTQQELADSAGLKIGGVRDLEQGRRKPTWETVLSLCAALGVKPNVFAEEPGDQPEPKRGRPRKAEADAGRAGESPTTKRKTPAKRMRRKKESG